MEEKFFKNFEINKCSLYNEFDYNLSNLSLKIEQLQYLFSYEQYRFDKTEKETDVIEANTKRRYESQEKEKKERKSSSLIKKLEENQSDIDLVQSQIKDYNLESSQCIICKKNNSVKHKLQKCYSNSCRNMFCQDCYSRNHYQARSSNYKCSYFSCDSCLTQKVCIMSTILFLSSSCLSRSSVRLTGKIKCR